MTSLTVKAFAELIHTPLYGQLRILNEQKYPSRAPAAFKIKYYQPAINVIRRYYRQGNDLTALPTQGILIPGIGTKPDRIENNFRAIDAFRRSSQRHRTLSIQRQVTWDLSIANVEFRSTPELAFMEGRNQGYMMIDCRLNPIEEEIIRTTLELIHHTLEVNGASCPMRRIEYVHLASDKVSSWQTPRRRTIERANQTAMAIQTLWDSI